MLRLSTFFVLALLLTTSCAAQARDRAQVRAFRKDNPCPATDKTSGACSGFVVDHIVPLCAGGRDHPSNMQWQSRADSLIKDNDERRLCAGLRRS
jgi:hypothetical protein